MKKNKLYISLKSATANAFSAVATLFSIPQGVVFVNLPGRFFIRR